MEGVAPPGRGPSDFAPSASDEGSVWLLAAIVVVGSARCLPLLDLSRCPCPGLGSRRGGFHRLWRLEAAEAEAETAVAECYSAFV